MTVTKKVVCTLILFQLLALSGCGPAPGDSTAASTVVTAAPTLSPTLLPDTPAPELSPTAWQELSGSGGGVIAFVSDLNGSPGIYLMNADGSDQRMLSNNYDVHPDWSPDGKTIAYFSKKLHI